jgi:hypothetical protein
MTTWKIFYVGAIVGFGLGWLLVCVITSGKITRLERANRYYRGLLGRNYEN